MHNIETFIDEFESDPCRLLKDENKIVRMKQILFSLFKLLTPDLKNQSIINDIFTRFDYDQLSLWNSLEIILRPELKKLYRKIEKIQDRGTENHKTTEHLNIYLNQENSYFNSFFDVEKIGSIKNKDSQLDLSKENIKNKTSSVKYESNDIEDNKNNVDLFDYNEMMNFIDEDIEQSSYTDSNIQESENFSISDIDDDARNLKYDDFFLKKNVNNKTIENMKEYTDFDIEDINLTESSVTESDIEKSSIYLNNNLFEPNSINSNSKDHLQDNTLYSNEIMHNKSKLDKNSELDNSSNIKKEQERMNAVIDKLEAEIIREKEWYKLGESSGTKREKNSLLGLYLEVPQFSSMNNSETISEADDLQTKNDLRGISDSNEINSYIEKVLKQRIVDNLFDDVEPKESLLEMLDADNDQYNDEIQMEKSNLGLADIYSKKYEEQVIGSNTDVMVQEKKLLIEQFANIMRKLDNLSNQYFASNLIIYNESENITDVPALKVEDTVPVIISDSSRLAPQELKKKTEFISKSEMSREEKRSIRNQKKRRFAKTSTKNSSKDSIKMKKTIRKGNITK